MQRRAIPRKTIFLVSVGILCAGAIAVADGYRPPSELADSFVESLPTAEIVVFPTVIRDPFVSRYSLESRDLAIRLLEEYGVGGVTASDRELHLGEPAAPSQYAMFQNAIRTMAEEIGRTSSGVDYFLLIDVLFPPGPRDKLEVFGIHMYVLTPQGDNAFSFILNSHHDAFRAARLESSDATARGKERLAVRGTTVAVEALKKQVADARACIAREAGRTSPRPGSPMIDDFEHGLVRGTDRYDVEVGFSTFAGPDSRVKMSTTDRHPSVPGKASRNSVLQMNLNVKSWAGVLHRFAHQMTDQWVSYDWRGARELSFWIYGHNAGTTLVVDVLDNRNRCSTVDDAERYSYTFMDNFEGWKLISIPFEVMTRKEIGNDAPNDGLGLGAVHGWGIAILDTKGGKRYWMDDVRLRYTPLLADVPEGVSREKDIWVPVNELPMYGEFEKTAWQKQADETFMATVLPDFGNDRGAAADRFAEEAWKFVYGGDNTTAIKRFNQAWLLDPENTKALWGFAVISRARGKTDAALRFYALAIERGGAWPKLVAEYEEYREAQEER
ncbi:MAG: carbohydrate binding domain-containing protein [Woeseiaceae bacterium]|jgi:hypothetical protein|nr:carbohydrate binding domain-containing protein [Woeseiaceae bacterium]